MKSLTDFNSKNEFFYYQMYLIRRFEELLFELLSNGEIFGTTHTCIGQEAISVGALHHADDNDIVISNHRCHGHYLAKTGDLVGLLSEMMGKQSGACKGRGGSQHLYKEGFFSNGLLGNMVPVAAGLSFAKKINGNNSMVILFLGDGAFGEGTVYETLNMIGLYKLPILIIVENNQYAQSTHISHNLSGTLSERISAFNISVNEIETNDVNKIDKRFKTILESRNFTGFPHVEIINTYRLGPHSKGDDFREKSEIDFWKSKDPLLYTKKLLKNNQINDIEKLVNNLITNTLETVRNTPFAKELN